MRTQTRCIFVIVLLGLGLSSFPALAKSLPKHQAEVFLDRIIKGEIDNAYDRIFDGTSTQKLKAKDLELVKAQTRAGLPLYGNLQGWEMLSETPYGSRLVKFKYALYTEMAPIIWIFHFYRIDDTRWDLYHIYFDDKPHSLDR